MQTFLLHPLFLMISIFISTPSHSLVFERDQRFDLSEVKNQKVQKLSDSVFTFIQKSQLIRRLDGNFEFAVKKTLNETIGLCYGERFAHQPSVGTRCSGFLISPELGVTAGHCVSPLFIPNFCQNYYIVFDYKENIPGQAPLVLSPKSVYQCEKIAKLEFDPNRPTDDYAILKFASPAINRNPLKFRSAGKIPNNEPIFMLGYPRGLPQKISAGRTVVKNNDVSSFSTELDCFHGNSGSPVFSARTLDVEGIFVRGQGHVPNNSQDPKLIGDFTFDQQKKCYKTQACLRREGCTATMEATRTTRLQF